MTYSSKSRSELRPVNPEPLFDPFEQYFVVRRLRRDPAPSFRAMSTGVSVHSPSHQDTATPIRPGGYLRPPLSLHCTFTYSFSRFRLMFFLGCDKAPFVEARRATPSSNYLRSVSLSQKYHEVRDMSSSSIPTGRSTRAMFIALPCFFDKYSKWH